jgi:hypothetical protein
LRPQSEAKNVGLSEVLSVLSLTAQNRGGFDQLLLTKIVA